ncbi:hypothetical protein NUACC21_57020 [Scytonema sp. NUACC21]
MNQQGQIQDIAVFNENSLQELIWAIESSQGEFSLVLANCNSANFRQRLTQKLQTSCHVKIQEISLDTSIATLYTTIQAQVEDKHPEAVIVYGLDSVRAIDSILKGANQVREEFRKNFSFPVVLWVTDEILQKLIRLAPDLHSWTTTVEFATPTEDLIQCIQQTADEVFAKVLEVGAGRYLDNTALNLEIGSPRRTELELARAELYNRGVTLHPEIEASLEFVLGRDVRGSMEQSRLHYERSLALLQQAGGMERWGDGEMGRWEETENLIQPIPHFLISSTEDLRLSTQQLLERRACLVYCMGLWWRTYAVLNHTESDRARALAKDYFQECITVFEQANREDLVANFINGLGAVLQRMQCWDELEVVAHRAITLHQIYPHEFRLARAYGFLAEVSLAKSAWKEALAVARQALTILNRAVSAAENSVSSETKADLEWEQSSHQGWYLFALARAQVALGEKTEAIATLETARTQTKSQYDPELYILILCELRDCCFEQGEYLKAFHIKQEQRTSEQKYGFRAFTGAGRLQPKQPVTNPSLALVEQQETVAQEIAATGREQDIKRLVERMGSPDRKLTIIYGQSGVGKSSILQAGLIPILKHKAIGTRDVVPVLQQVYPDWIRELGDRLAEALADRQTTVSSIDGVNAILNQLHTNADAELLTVLIFDQFEEFFFVYKDPKQRLIFYNFLRDCLDVPHVRVILSLREDYLYYLLECNDRLTNLEVINNNILDKDILYYLGNFSRKDAKALIQSFTYTTKLSLELSLIDALVEDLAGDFGEIRPIELQVVGMQIQTEKITTLAQYQEHGPKEELVGRFLEEVVKDCGVENEQMTKLVLYLLTDENNTRPLKTRADLELELEVKAETLDLVLLILVKSGLVFKVPAVPSDRYQLVHDYLVPFVRQQQSERLIAELEKEREQRKLTEARLLQVTQKQLRDARRATFTLAGLVVAIGGFAVTATITGLNLYLNNLSSSSAKDSQLETLVSHLKAVKTLQQFSLGALPGTQLNVIANFNQAYYTTREVNHLKGHQATVTSVSFSPNDKLLATVSEDKTVKIWSISGQQLQTIKGHTSTITSVSFSPNGRLLATASKDKTVKIWKVKDGRLMRTFNAIAVNVTSVSFSPNGKILAVSDGTTVKMWSLSSGEKFNQLDGHTTNITSVSFSPDGNFIASADNDDTVKLWRSNGKLIKNIDNYGAINIRFSLNGKNLIITNKDGTIKIYDLNGILLKDIRSNNSSIVDVTDLSPDEKLLALVLHYSNNIVNIIKTDGSSSFSKELGSHKDSITYLSFSHDGKLLASASKDKTVKLWSIDSKAFRLPKDDSDTTYKVKFSPDSKIIAASYSNQVRLWSQDGNFIRTIDGDGSFLNFSPDSKTIATESSDRIIQIWNSNGQKMTLRGQTGNVADMALSPDGKIIASTDYKTVQLWRSNGTFIKNLAESSDGFPKVQFSPDGKIIAAIEEDNKVILWKSSDGSFIKTLEGHTTSVSNITFTFSPDSQIIATNGDDNVVKVWSREGTLIKTLTGHSHTVTSVVFSPDSKIIASVSQGDNGVNSAVKLWYRDGREFTTINDYGIQEIRFSPDGKIIASINQDKTVKLWNIDGKLLRIFNKHNDTINDLTFSPSEETIASTSDDRKIQLWRKNGTIIKTLREHTSGVKSIKFSPNGEFFISVGNDNMVLLWSRDGKLFKTLQKGSKETSYTYSIIINISSDSKQIAFYSKAYSNNYSKFTHTVKVWKSNGKLIKAFQSRNEIPFSFSPDTKTLAVALKEDARKLWNIDDGRILATFRGLSNQRNNISFSQNWNTFASISEDNTVKIWNRESIGKFPTYSSRALKAQNYKANSVSVSPDGQIIASTSDDNTVELWDNNGFLLKPLEHNSRLNSVSFSPNGQIIASAGEDNNVLLWKRDGTLLRLLPHTESVKSVSFSPDGNMILSITTNNTIKLWNINGGEIKTIEGSSSSHFPFSFSNDSKLLAVLNTNYSEGRLKLYNLNGVWFKDYEVFGFNPSIDLSFSPDGKSIATASEDGVLVLSLDRDELLKRGCNWAHDYLKNSLKNNPDVDKSDRTLCDKNKQ